MTDEVIKLRIEIDSYKRTMELLIKYVNKLHEEMGVSFRLAQIDETKVK